MCLKNNQLCINLFLVFPKSSAWCPPCDTEKAAQGVCDRDRSSQTCQHPGASSARPNPSSPPRLHWNVAAGQGRTRRKRSLEWTYLGKKPFQLFQKEENQPNNPVPSFKSYFFLMTHGVCQSLGLQTHIQLQPHHQICSAGVTLAHWDHNTRLNKGYGLLEPAGNKHITELKLLPSTNPNTSCISSVCWYQHRSDPQPEMSICISAKLLSCPQPQKGIRNLGKYMDFTGPRVPDEPQPCLPFPLLLMPSNSAFPTNDGCVHKYLQLAEWNHTLFHPPIHT